MLIEFTVGNYLSFKDKVTFSMVATDLGAKTELDENNTFQVDEELSLLKSAAVYGANASGKSNLVQAISFMQWFVINSSSSTQITDLIDVSEFKLSTQTINEPSFFEIVFLLENKVYRYGFELTKKKIISEWLYYTPKTKEYKYFERKKQKINIIKRFTEGQLLESKTRPNALFLSVVAQFNGKISQKILFWFLDLIIISGVKGNLLYDHTANLMYRSKEYEKNIIDLIRKLDLSISDIVVKDIDLSPDEFSKKTVENISEEEKNKSLNYRITKVKVVTIHKQYNHNGNVSALQEFDLDLEESEGTQKLFAFAAPIIITLKTGRTLVIDELEARLHPLITQSIIKLFNSKATNPHNAQLIFMTHDTNLLTKKLFRPDQIWFTEKDNYEATDLYSLVEYKISDDASFEDDYIKGKYGAIPFIGNLKDLII